MTKEQETETIKKMIQIIDLIRNTQTEENSELLFDYFENFFTEENKKLFHILRQDEMKEGKD